MAAPRQHFVEHAAERVLVDATVEPGATERLLGTHVARRAERDAGRGNRSLRAIGRSGDAEVAQLGVARRQEDVLGLQVAVDDAAAMRVFEGIGHFAGDADRIIDRHRTFPRQPRPESLALDEWHHEEDRVVARARIN
ncbi:hypothetical protein Strain138_000228 [Pseudogemmatithrix spongiicola]|uniref:Uncharacterized protein n=1 Tax=Pseudogemmatithrix spongiicola TaxID=3062599 RepID=A0AA49Q3S1_9BACT|nr:hypothetical protein Strain138_000228 [Gemmatimonadaceae bacterium 'strain 138']WKW13904.1 hypothetical protein Strain318_000228 [Gemmatimonadaceae bacterium 'strain 318']